MDNPPRPRQDGKIDKGSPATARSGGAESIEPAFGAVPEMGSRHRRPHIIDRYERQAGPKCGLAAGVEPVGRRAAGCRDGGENDVGEGPAAHGHLTRLSAGCEVTHSLTDRFCRDRAAAGGPSNHRWILSTHVQAWRRVRLPTAPPTVNALGRDEMSAIDPGAHRGQGPGRLILAGTSPGSEGLTLVRARWNVSCGAARVT